MQGVPDQNDRGKEAALTALSEKPLAPQPSTGDKSDESQGEGECQEPSGLLSPHQIGADRHDAKDAEHRRCDPLVLLGPEAEDIQAEELGEIARRESRRLHPFLRDQRALTGIGRAWSNEILNRAKLSPYAALGKLDAEQRERLIQGLHAILTDALEVERRRSGGLPTKIGDHFTVHGRWGQPCPRCGADLRRVSYESHEVTYCPDCQTEGKILADRRLSRLIR